MDIDKLVLSVAAGFLRPLRAEDVHPGYVTGLNDPIVNRYLVAARQCTQTVETVTEFIRKNLESDTAILFDIWETGAERHCGTVRLLPPQDFVGHLTGGHDAPRGRWPWEDARETGRQGRYTDSKALADVSAAGCRSIGGQSVQRVAFAILLEAREKKRRNDAVR